MRQLIYFFIVAITSIFMLHACGPSEEELERERQARQDSIEAARQDSIERIRAEQRRQARLDSIEAARQDSIERARNRIVFDSNGPLTVQVESWRSKEKAQERADVWKDRGYDRAYVITYGEKETGDVWFRIRLGRVATHQMAEKLVDKLKRQHNVQKVWIAPAKEDETVPPDDEEMMSD
jgi:septal ring-binding cell division protein DamX